MPTLNKYLLVVSILGCCGAFSWGYYRGLHSERLKNTVEGQQIEIKRLNTLLATERSSSESANKKSQELETSLNVERNKNETITKAIQRDRDNINKLNTINRDFVRYIQATAESMPITTITSESSESSATVPADRVLHYTVDLKSAFDKCRVQNNKLIEFYNFLRD